MVSRWWDLGSYSWLPGGPCVWHVACPLSPPPEWMNLTQCGEYTEGTLTTLGSAWVLV